MTIFDMQNIFIGILSANPTDYASEGIFKFWWLSGILEILPSSPAKQKINAYCIGYHDLRDKVPCPKYGKMSDSAVKSFNEIKLIALEELRNILKSSGYEEWVRQIEEYYKEEDRLC